MHSAGCYDLLLRTPAGMKDLLPGAKGAVQKAVLSVSLGRERVAWPKNRPSPHQGRASQANSGQCGENKASPSQRA